MNEIRKVALEEALQRADWLIDSRKEYERLNGIFGEALDDRLRWEELEDRSAALSYNKKIDQVCQGLKIDLTADIQKKLKLIRYRLDQSEKYLASLP